jgi:hypothetical protein
VANVPTFQLKPFDNQAKVFSFAITTDVDGNGAHTFGNDPSVYVPLRDFTDTGALYFPALPSAAFVQAQRILQSGGQDFYYPSWYGASVLQDLQLTEGYAVVVSITGAVPMTSYAGQVVLRRQKADGIEFKIPYIASSAVAVGEGLGYASLTGPGETETPGQLTQAGNLIVNANAGTGGEFQVNTDEAGEIQLNLGESGQFAMSANEATLSVFGSVLIDTTGDGGTVELQAPGASVVVGTAGTTVSGDVGFFDTAPVVQQVSGGTLAGVIAGLKALGLFSS